MDGSANSDARKRKADNNQTAGETASSVSEQKKAKESCEHDGREDRDRDHDHVVAETERDRAPSFSTDNAMIAGVGGGESGNEDYSDSTNPQLSQSERKLRRERRRRNDLHQGFCRLINTLSKYHPEVSRRAATDDDPADIIGSASAGRGGSGGRARVVETIPERLARAVESGGGARDILAAAMDTGTKLNRIDIIDYSVEAIEELLADREVRRAKAADLAEQLARKDQEIATLRMSVQQQSIGSLSQVTSGAGVMASAVGPGPNQGVPAADHTLSAAAAVPGSHPLVSMQDVAARVQQAILSRNQAATTNGPAMRAGNAATAGPSIGHANVTLPFNTGASVTVPVPMPAGGASIVLNPTTPGMGTLIVNSPGRVASVVPAAAGNPVNHMMSTAPAVVPGSSGQGANTNAAVIAAASLLAEASRNNNNVPLGLFIQPSQQPGPSANGSGGGIGPFM